LEQKKPEKQLSKWERESCFRTSALYVSRLTCRKLQF